MDNSARWSLRLPAPLALAGFALDIPLNRAAKTGERLAARLGPDEWLLVAPAARINGALPPSTANAT